VTIGKVERWLVTALGREAARSTRHSGEDWEVTTLQELGGDDRGVVLTIGDREFTVVVSER
jgi:hypothetical protein